MSGDRSMAPRAFMGTGMLGQAADAVATAPSYPQYVVDAQSSGIQPLPQNDPNWMAHYYQMMGISQPHAVQGLLSQ